MAVNFLLAVFVWFLIPETKGIALEEMDTLFGGTNHVEAGAELMEDCGIGKRIDVASTENAIASKEIVQTTNAAEEIAGSDNKRV